ncbi:Mini-ribonuclease 3 [Floridanema evergladense]|uniref:Mini-ribonuclease 3 n=1 Tax=Floridaenema evergladense BLCC-F167 TaxID=3153639 RepID=A0ABV4WL06_9CYAN
MFHQPLSGINCSLSEVNQLSPVALAYIGDAVFELYVRSRYLFPTKRIDNYHRQVVCQVRAESQVRHLRSLQPHLTEAESEILRRGRNAAGSGPKRLSAKIYQEASSLETLIGYLYLTDSQRLAQLLAKLDFDFPQGEES